MVQKYLKKIKLLYVRVSKYYGEKLWFSGLLSSGSGVKVSFVEVSLIMSGKGYGVVPGGMGGGIGYVHRGRRGRSKSGGRMEPGVAVGLQSWG